MSAPQLCWVHATWRRIADGFGPQWPDSPGNSVTGIGLFDHLL
jgi:hypothetical protein